MAELKQTGAVTFGESKPGWITVRVVLDVGPQVVRISLCSDPDSQLVMIAAAVLVKKNPNISGAQLGPLLESLTFYHGEGRSVMDATQTLRDAKFVDNDTLVASRQSTQAHLEELTLSPIQTEARKILRGE